MGRGRKMRALATRAEAEMSDGRDWGEALYRAAPLSRRPAQLTAIPYYLWDNREPGEMLVWIPE